ncbi:hypothetical protein FRC03_012577 [Tulasnella sp. 419]|nr:hypothetical protein FRC03_012577 [Tulasnella sp. 419]
MTATRDPRIVPRDLDPDPTYPQMTTTAASDSSPPVPLPHDLRVRNGTVREDVLPSKIESLRWAEELYILYYLCRH